MVIIERSFDWTPVVVALASLGGVILGAALAAGLELYRRALDAQSAARLIRIETIDNRAKAEELAAERPIRSRLESAAWRELRLVVAPFLDEVQLIKLAQSYAEARDLQLIPIPSTGHLTLDQRDKLLIERWLVRMQDQARRLREIEARNPWLLATRLVRRRRVATQEEIRAAYGITDETIQQHAERMEKRKAQVDEVTQP